MCVHVSQEQYNVYLPSRDICGRANRGLPQVNYKRLLNKIEVALRSLSVKDCKNCPLLVSSFVRSDFLRGLGVITESFLLSTPLNFNSGKTVASRQPRSCGPPDTRCAFELRLGPLVVGPLSRQLAGAPSTRQHFLIQSNFPSPIHSFFGFSLSSFVFIPIDSRRFISSIRDTEHRSSSSNSDMMIDRLRRREKEEKIEIPLRSRVVLLLRRTASSGAP